MNQHHPPTAVCPRSVTPGIENHPDHDLIPAPGVYVGLDWFRFTGAEDSHLTDLNELLQEFAGTTPELTAGAAYYTRGKVWKPGVLLSWGHSRGICQVDIQGSRLRLMNGDDRMSLLRLLARQGISPTRIDGCLDFVDQGLSVYDNARQSCDNDELCRLRSYGDNARRTVGHRPDRLHLNLGRRDSPVCGRIYDKGLQTKTTRTAGRWERLEIEWKSDRASDVLRRLHAAGDEWVSELAALVFGAVDFREFNGQTSLARRPRCAWWERVIDCHRETATSPASKSSDLTKWIESLGNSYGRRILEFAAAVGRPSEQVFAWLVAGLEPSDNGGQLVREFEQAFCTTPGRHVMTPRDSQ